MSEPSVESESDAKYDVDLALPRLKVLLSQQEKLLNHPLSNADIYLYDLRAQQICEMIAELEENNAVELLGMDVGRETVSAMTRNSSSVENSATTKKKKVKSMERIVLVALSSRKHVSDIFARIWSLLSLPLFRQGRNAKVLAARSTRESGDD